MARPPSPTVERSQAAQRLAAAREQIARNRDSKAPYGPEDQFDPYREFGERLDVMLAADGQKRDKQLIALGNEFLNAAERGKPATLRGYMQEGFPVTWQDPDTGATALHIVAARQARNALRTILETGGCDFLLRDNRGRLSSEMGYLYGEDVAVARLLRIKERKQAEAQGIELTRRPKRS